MWGCGDVSYACDPRHISSYQALFFHSKHWYLKNEKETNQLEVKTCFSLVLYSTEGNLAQCYAEQRAMLKRILLNFLNILVIPNLSK